MNYGKVSALMKQQTSPVNLKQGRGKEGIGNEVGTARVLI